MVQYDWSSGLIFSNLTLTGKSYFSLKRRYVEAICKCGRIKWVRFDSIKRGLCTSCGCIVKDRLSKDKPATKHGLSDDYLYSVYKHMIGRCYDKKDSSYHSYGGIGVTVCDEWRSDIHSFFNWTKGKWKEGLQLDKDKIYSEKYGTKTGLIYSPEYCCFLTAKENGRVTSRSRHIMYKGETKSLIEWSELTGINDKTLGERLNRYGWSIEKALSTPLLRKSK